MSHCQYPAKHNTRYIRDKCLRGGCASGDCVVCVGSEGCNPCRIYAATCLDQHTEECVGE